MTSPLLCGRSPLLVLMLGLAACGQPELSPAPTPSASPLATDSPAKAPQPSAASSVFEDLAAGEAAEADCGDTPQFSPSGETVACAGQLAHWPSMAPIVDLEGTPSGWGELDGVEQLLLRVAAEGFETLETSGARHTIDTTGLEGRITPTWSPRRDAIWVQSGLQTPHMRLDAWSPDGRRELATLPNNIGATNITASPDEQWVAIWGGGCAVSQAGTGCALTLGVSRAGADAPTPVVANLDGVLASVWVSDDGTVLFTVAGQDGRVNLWRAPPGSPAEAWFEGVTVSTLVGPRLAVTSAEAAAVIDIATATEAPLVLPDDVAPADILSVSPNGNWLAYRSDEATVSFRHREQASSSTELPLPSLTGVGVLWPGDDQFAAVFVGPPPTTIIVRLTN